jgi:UDP-N-acetylglucosamine acyltransferase
MPTQIHPSAIVDPAAKLGTDVVVGPYAFVGAGVQLGDGTVLHHHATVEGNTPSVAATRFSPSPASA